LGITERVLLRSEEPLMVEVAERAVEAAWKIRNLEDYDRRLERAARRVDEFVREHEAAPLVIYEAALMKSGRPAEEVRDLVRRFRDTFEDEEEPFNIPRVSGVMSVEGDEWFFGDGELRAMTGRLLGQFQHRVAQYNYIDEREVLKRWADGYDTRLFIRRRIYETEPVVGVVAGFDLPLVQYLRVAAGGDTLVPTAGVARALEALGFEPTSDEYEILARAENLALHLDLPAPIVGEMLEEISREGLTDFPEPPRDLASTGEGDEEEAGEEKAPAPSLKDRDARRAARREERKGEEPTRVQDPQSRDAPGVPEEEGAEKSPAPPEAGREQAPGTDGREER
jgi:hypothetical protein